MKSKSTEPGDSRKRGFYTALVSCIGAVIVLALVITFTNLTSTPDIIELTEYPYEEAAPVGFDTVRPYQAQADLDQALFRPRPAPTPAETPPPEPSPEPPTSRQEDRPAPEVQPAPQPEPQAEAPVATEPPPAPERPAAETPAEQATFAAFTDEDEMIWPVYGDVAMIFSQDALIYNATLDQWRTNDDLRISAQEGTPVRATAAGRVAEIGQDHVYGNFVRIYNGNGWETIFGQLMDGILVAEGDIVQTGQVIGGVGRPTDFTILDGHHVSLRVLQDNVLVDPKSVLAELY